MSELSAKEMQQKKEQRMLSISSNDPTLKKQIQATHTPYGREVVVYPIINVAEQILIEAIARSGAVLGKQQQADTSEMASDFAKLDMHDTLIIQKLSCELSSHEWSGGGHAHATTMELLNTLSSYSWHAKVALILSAFAVNFGAFWLFAQPYSTDKLANSLALFKQLPDIVDNSSSLIHQFDTLNKLVKATLDVTKCIVEIKNLPSQYISEDTPAMSVSIAYFPVAVYWTIRSIVTCSSHIANLISLKNEYLSMISSTSEASDLSSLVQRVFNIHEHLKNQLAICYQYIYDKKILQPLIYEKDSDGVRKSKHVLLLISDLDISEDTIRELKNLYEDQQKRYESTAYEIFWVPIVDPLTWNELNEGNFYRIKSNMTWQSLQSPVVEPALIKHIKETLNFTREPIVVTLDPQGKLICPNALHMMMIWGNLAFPFSCEKEKNLWQEQIWSLEIIVGGIDASILEWMRKGKLICLYGGEDLEWIRTFRRTAASVAMAANISLEMVYVGKRNAKEQMQRMITILSKEKLSHFWSDVKLIWLFWTRLESMMYSKMEQGKTVENDQLMNEVKTLLTLDSSDLGWAMFVLGSSPEMVTANASTILKGLRDFDRWKENAERDGFVWALNDYLHQLNT